MKADSITKADITLIHLLLDHGFEDELVTMMVYFLRQNQDAVKDVTRWVKETNPNLSEMLNKFCEVGTKVQQGTY